MEKEKENIPVTLFLDNFRIQKEFDSASECFVYLYQNNLIESEKELNNFYAENYNGNIMALHNLKTVEEHKQYIKNNSSKFESIFEMINRLKDNLINELK
jgi:hypothetical protein